MMDNRIGVSVGYPNKRFLITAVCVLVIVTALLVAQGIH
jgi:hypothetical protein